VQRALDEFTHLMIVRMIVMVRPCGSLLPQVPDRTTPQNCTGKKPGSPWVWGAHVLRNAVTIYLDVDVRQYG